VGRIGTETSFHLIFRTGTREVSPNEKRMKNDNPKVLVLKDSRTYWDKTLKW